MVNVTLVISKIKKKKSNKREKIYMVKSPFTHKEVAVKSRFSCRSSFFSLLN